LIFYSDDDAITWKKFGDKIDVGGLSGLNGIVWDGTIIVVVGFGVTNNIAYSSDEGLTWTGTGYKDFSMVMCISYDGDNFVAGGIGKQKIAYSSDEGVTWTETGSNVFTKNDSFVNGLTYGNNTFVAVGGIGSNDDTLIAYSINGGKSWDSGYKNTSIYELTSVSFGNNMFVAVGDGIIIYSLDGINWNISLINVSFYQIIWCKINLVFVVINHLNNTIGYSSDGKTWKNVIATELDSAGLVVCNGSRIVISGDTSNAYLSFPNSVATLEYEKKTSTLNLELKAIISME
jgi:hypothetical protein